MSSKSKKRSTGVVPVAKTVRKARRKKKIKKVVLKRGPIVRAAEMIGGVMAPGIGSRVGRLAGYAGQALYNYISGSGDYMISKNSLMGVTNVPSFGETTIRLRAREYITDVSGSTLFLNTAYSINPGNPVLFPWLSSIATKFQQYEFNGLIFEFVSTSSNALSSTNTALGKVVMATSYNVSDLPFPDVKSALITQFSNMGKPSDNLVHAVECRRSSMVLDNLYVRSTTTAVPDPKFYDIGNFQFITEGMQAVADIGGLWVSYDVTFSKPTLELSGADIPSQVWNIPGVSGAPLGTSVDSPVPPAPEVAVLPFSINSTNMTLSIERPQIGDNYLYHWYGTGPVLPASITVLYVTDGIASSTLFPRRHTASLGFGFAYFTYIFQVTNTTPETLPFVGFSATISSAFPNGWTANLLVTKLNDAAPLFTFPAPLVQEHKLERYRRLMLDLVEKKSEVPADEPEELPKFYPPSRGRSAATPVETRSASRDRALCVLDRSESTRGITLSERR